jgi:hypothetical protein
MKKIPVGETIRFAYAFTLGQIGTIIGLIWVPMLIYVVGSFFVLRGYYEALANSIENDAVPMGPQMVLPFLFVFVTFFLVAMMSVAVMQQALGLRHGPAYVHFALGNVELRVFGGFFALYLLLLGFLLALVLGAALIAGTGAALANGNAAINSSAALVAGVAVLIGILALIYVFVRLSFLFIPCAIVDGDFGLAKSWQLTEGNFWRIFAIGLTTIMPILLLLGIAESAILGPAIFLPDLNAKADAAVDLHRMAEQMRVMQANMPLLMGLSFVVAPLTYGLLLAPAAAAYKALTGKSGA